MLNYCMDTEHPVLSHQVQAVNSLANVFDEVVVITGQLGTFQVSKNVRVISSNWTKEQPIRNFFKFMRVILPMLLTQEFTSIFSHMTEVQSALISPITKLLRIRHYLWYAHAHRSKYLVWCHFWLTGIITSTPGSCPIGGSKVHPIGQAINNEDFVFTAKEKLMLTEFIHIGRFDPSKRVENIIQAIMQIRSLGGDQRLKLIGSPSTNSAKIEAQKLKAKYSFAVSEGWLQFIDSIPRSSVTAYLLDSDVFIHSYIGSLDKTLVEATMIGLPVVTINPEYISQFGSWSMAVPVTLVDEVEALLACAPKELTFELQRRREYSVLSHSLLHWTDELSRILH